MRRRGTYKKTVDQGQFDEPLKPMRRSICIQQKLEVVNYYNQLKAEKKKDEEKLTEPRPVGVTQAELKKKNPAEKGSQNEIEEKSGKDVPRKISWCCQTMCNLQMGSKSSRGAMGSAAGICSKKSLWNEQHMETPGPSSFEG